MFPIASPAQIAAALTEFGLPRVIAELNGSAIQAIKMRGSSPAWHCDADGDVLFMVLKGYLRIEMDTGVAELIEGEMFVVPQGVRHQPVAEEECHLLLIQRPATRPQMAAALERAASKTRLITQPTATESVPRPGLSPATKNPC